MEEVIGVGTSDSLVCITLNGWFCKHGELSLCLFVYPIARILSALYFPDTAVSDLDCMSLSYRCMLTLVSGPGLWFQPSLLRTASGYSRIAHFLNEIDVFN